MSALYGWPSLWRREPSANAHAAGGLSSFFKLCQLSFQVFDGFFSIAYSLLNFASLLFGFPFGFQIAVTRTLSDLLLDCSLQFVEAAFELVFRAGSHTSPSPS